MEKLLSVFVISMMLFFAPKSNNGYAPADALEGAWEMNRPDGSPEGLRTVMTIELPYVFITQFNEEKKEFYFSQGGTMEVQGSLSKYTVEFNTLTANDIGMTYEISNEINGAVLTSSLEIGGSTQTVTYTRIDDGNSDLAGSWRITDRMRDGEMQAMRLGARKTIKMITGSRFQWAAFNPETKEFSGTGGGSITLKDGKYTEHIEFFSRNADRVGANLTFNYQVNGDKWEHSGLSSSGNPIKEIWTRQ